MGIRDATKTMLAQALDDLLKTTPLQKVSVKSLCEQCGAERQTFYYHFKDILDVIEWTYEIDLVETAKKCSEMRDIQASIKMFADEIVKHYPEMRRLLSSKYRTETEMILLRSLRKFFGLIIKAKYSDIDYNETQKKFIVDFFVCGMVAYFIEHCFSSQATDTETFSKEIYKLVISRINNKGSD